MLFDLFLFLVSFEFLSIHNLFFFSDYFFFLIDFRFNRKKQKHRIEYEDGDHEWLLLQEEHDRVMIFEVFLSVSTFVAFIYVFKLQNVIKLSALFYL